MIRFIFGVLAGLYLAQNFNVTFDDVAGIDEAKEELEEVIRRLKWSRIQEEQLWPLWEQAARFRLRRLTTFHNDAMAAKGVASEANIAWLSVDEETRARLTAWGEEKGYTFPRDLAEFLSTLEEEEQSAVLEQTLAWSRLGRKRSLASLIGGAQSDESENIVKTFVF